MPLHYIRASARSAVLRGSIAAGVLVLGLALGAGSAAASEVIVGLVTKTEVNPFFVKMRQAAEARAKEKGVK
ncbi:sugar ABC transporter, partial [Sinorhizobium medicae]